MYSRFPCLPVDESSSNTTFEEAAAAIASINAIVFATA